MLQSPVVERVNPRLIRGFDGITIYPDSLPRLADRETRGAKLSNGHFVAAHGPSMAGRSQGVAEASGITE